MNLKSLVVASAMSICLSGFAYAGHGGGGGGGHHAGGGGGMHGGGGHFRAGGPGGFRGAPRHNPMNVGNQAVLVTIRWPAAVHVITDGQQRSPTWRHGESPGHPGGMNGVAHHGRHQPRFAHGHNPAATATVTARSLAALPTTPPALVPAAAAAAQLLRPAQLASASARAARQLAARHRPTLRQSGYCRRQDGRYLVSQQSSNSAFGGIAGSVAQAAASFGSGYVPTPVAVPECRYGVADDGVTCVIPPRRYHRHARKHCNCGPRGVGIEGKATDPKAAVAKVDAPKAPASVAAIKAPALTSIADAKALASAKRLASTKRVKPTTASAVTPKKVGSEI